LGLGAKTADPEYTHPTPLPPAEPSTELTPKSRVDAFSRTAHPTRIAQAKTIVNSKANAFIFLFYKI
jgi:hypothetical protein